MTYCASEQEPEVLPVGVFCHSLLFGTLSINLRKPSKYTSTPGPNSTLTPARRVKISVTAEGVAEGANVGSLVGTDGTAVVVGFAVVGTAAVGACRSGARA